MSQALRAGRGNRYDMASVSSLLAPLSTEFPSDLVTNENRSGLQKQLAGRWRMHSIFIV